MVDGAPGARHERLLRDDTIDGRTLASYDSVYEEANRERPFDVMPTEAVQSVKVVSATCGALALA